MTAPTLSLMLVASKARRLVLAARGEEFVLHLSLMGEVGRFAGRVRVLL